MTNWFQDSRISTTNVRKKKTNHPILTNITGREKKLQDPKRTSESVSVKSPKNEKTGILALEKKKKIDKTKKKHKHTKASESDPLRGKWKWTVGRRQKSKQSRLVCKTKRKKASFKPTPPRYLHKIHRFDSYPKFTIKARSMRWKGKPKAGLREGYCTELLEGVYSSSRRFNSQRSSRRMYRQRGSWCPCCSKKTRNVGQQQHQHNARAQSQPTSWSGGESFPHRALVCGPITLFATYDVIRGGHWFFRFVRR